MSKTRVRHHKKSSAKPDMSSKWHPKPLKASFMVIAILGLLLTIFWVSPASPDLGFAFTLVFIAMFIASIISMTHAPVVVNIKNK